MRTSLNYGQKSPNFIDFYGNEDLRAKPSWLQSARDQQRVQTYEVASRAGSSDLWTLGAKKRPNLRTHLDLNALVFKAKDLELKKQEKTSEK